MGSLQKIIKNILLSSRPGLWFATIWLYLLPTSGNYALFDSVLFWLGLFYCSFPINLLVYSWNDFVDIEADRFNPRKGSFLFGGRLSKNELIPVVKFAAVIQGAFALLFAWIDWRLFALLLAQTFVLYLYNHPTKGWRSRPPLELSCQLGYLLVVPFSVVLNNVPEISVFAYVYLFLFALQSHLMGEVMDIDPDRLAEKHTTATKIGRVKTKALILFLVAIEIGIVIGHFGDYVLAACLDWASYGYLLIYSWSLKTNPIPLIR